MTRLKRMRVVDAWLRSGQSTMDYADNLGLDVGALRSWVMEYGRPSAPSTLIPVRILDGRADRQRFDELHSGEDRKPDVHFSCELGSHWIQVVIQERP
jgi:hypothetical protein